MISLTIGKKRQIWMLTQIIIIILLILTLLSLKKNNPNISLNILDEDNRLIYASNNDSIKKAYIVKINEDRHAAIKPSSDNLIKTKQLIKKMSHTELEQILIHIIKCFKHNQLSKVLMGLIRNNILVESE